MNTDQINCPSCQASLPPHATNCIFCGFDLSIEEDDSMSWKESMCLSREASLALCLGLTAAMILVFADLSFTRFILRHFNILVHEFGHALFGWTSGFVSIPAFDFSHGGGVTMHMGHEPSKGILLMVILFFTWALYMCRYYKLIMYCVLGGFAFLILCFLNNWNQILILYGGHGTVVLMGGLFIFRGLSNVAVHHFAERVLYFFLGAFVILDEYQFTAMLKNDSSFRSRYLEGKAGLMNDFHRLAEHLDISLNSAVNMHAGFCLCVPLLAYTCYVVAMKKYAQ